MNLLHNMSAAPRTTVVLAGRTMAPSVMVFSLPMALIKAGLIEGTDLGTERNPAGPPDRYQAACDHVRQRWRTPPDLFAAIGEPRFLTAAVDFLIGWRPLPAHAALKFLICGDPRLCAGVQARCAGTLYLSRRQPDLTWERLLDAPVAFDDPLVATLA
jgi:hypothetical protein